MILAQVNSNTGISTILFFGTLGIFVMGIAIVLFIIFYQRKVISDQLKKIKVLITKVKELEAQLPTS